MLQVNPYYFFEFGRVIQSIVEWASSPRRVDALAASALKAAEDFLTRSLDPEAELPFPQSSDPATALRDLLLATLNTMTADGVTKSKILLAVTKFQHDYDAELGTKNFLVVEEIGIYSTTALLDRAHRHLDIEVLVALDKLTPSAQTDLAFAGRALALELNTASGFHALRSVEAVARSYHMTVKQRPAVVENQPLSAVINELRDYMKSSAGDKQRDALLSLNVELLSRIDRIFRCPIMHPEMTLDNQKAKKSSICLHP